MPLGLFSSGKAQVLAEEKPEKTAGSKKKEPKQLSETKCKGVTLKLDHTRVTIEKQIAEGGFAIVYIASDRKNTKFALKRQFTKENQKQLDACCREHSFLKQCVGHKNIVEFVDSYVNCLGNGIWECMLLTEYHHKNVFQLMNERSSANQYLTADEIQSIICDMCEAVSFIHNRPIPIIHRDLKVENVLISGHKPPNYVLCDFGSATTQVLSVEQNGVEYVRAEVERNTTMCYRSPEMIDLYSGHVLGLKGDIWALGVLLYRLCYFCVPFDESPLAIQSVNYQFPSFPNILDEIKVLIYMVLDIDVARRPSIYQLSALAFEAVRKALPRDIEACRQNSETCPSLEACLRLMRAERKPRNQKAPLPTTSATTTTTTSSAAPEPLVQMTASAAATTSSGETSVQPRLRPKPTTIVPNVPSISPVPPPIKEPEQRKAPATEFVHRQSFSGEDRLKAAETGPGGPLSCPLIKPADLGFTDLGEGPAVPRDRAQTDGKQRRAQETFPDVIFQQQHRRNVSDTSHVSRSAFKPYSSQTAVSATSSSGGGATTTATTSSAGSKHQVRSVEDVNILLNHHRTTTTTSSGGEWNPFLAAPFSTGVMDDSHFGEVFDEIRKKKATTSSSAEFSDTSSIDSRDPFGAAPFDQLTVSTSSSAAAVGVAAPGSAEDVDDDERQLLSEDSVEEERHVAVDGGTTSEDQQHEMDGEGVEKGGGVTEEDSEIDEQRMNDRRRYSYENIDGVGDDASSDSRGRTDRDDSEEEEEEDGDSRRGGDTSHDEDSQNTVGSEDGEGGSRPLLEDDGLEDDDDHELISSFSSVSAPHFPPLFVGTTTTTSSSTTTSPVPTTTTTTTNPFLRDELTPKMVSSSVDDEWDLGDRWTDRRDTVFERPVAVAPPPPAFAPATLPRQVTPLAAVCKLKPDLPTAAPVSIIPSMSTTSFPEAVLREPEDVPREPPVGTLISVGAPTLPPEPPSSSTAAAPPPPPPPPPLPVLLAKTETKAAKKEKKKEKKERKTREKEKASSEMETDGSEAEMWAVQDAGKKKKKSTFGLRSSHPSIVVNEMQFSAPIPSVSSNKKANKDKKSSSVVKKSSVGSATMASFVNTSFQPEDPDADISTDL